MTKRLFIALLFTTLVSSSFAQGLTTYFMDIVPQSSRTNPGLMPRAKFYLGLPIISGFDIALVNNGFVFADLFAKQGGSKLDLDFMLKGLNDRNYLSLNTNLDLFSFGFKVKENNYFSFNLTNRFAFNFDYSRDFMTFLAQGTVPFVGKTLSLEDTKFRFSAYNEYGFGYTRKFNNRLTAGTKIKLLQGLAVLNSEQTEIKLETNPDYSSITATSTIGVRMAGLGFVTDTNSSSNPAAAITSFSNMGFAIDLGGSYKINDKITVSASAIDLGFITWQTDARRYYNNKASFTWNGLDAYKFMSDTNASKNYASHLADSLQNIFGLQRSDQSFTSTLVGNLYMGGQYNFNKWFHAGMVLHGQIYQGRLYPSFTAIGGTKLGSLFHFNLSYSIMNTSFANIGAALALNLGPIQIYAAGDNVLGLTQVDYAKTLNARIGINVMTGYTKKLSKDEKRNEKIKRELSKKDSDGDGVNDYDDKCKDVAGKAEHKGCPDKDGDGVADNEDICPTEFGHPETNGCPDQDNDLVADRVDACPDVYGTMKGCPDEDKDSIPDKDDGCPSAKGPASSNGCPDTDGDGVTDDRDECPLLKGDAAHDGCPDSDGDSVFDNEDKCPTEAGKPELNGCTDKDTDHDFTPDVFDACPFRVGPAENKGCPVE